VTTSPRSGAGRLAGRIAGTYPLADTYHLAALEAQMVRLTSTVSKLVPEATGLELPGNPSTVVIGRSEWVERNLASFSHLIEPVRLHLEERVADAGPGARGAAALTSLSLLVWPKSVPVSLVGVLLTVFIACFFRNPEHFKIAIYFHCGGLDLYPHESR